MGRQYRACRPRNLADAIDTCQKKKENETIELETIPYIISQNHKFWLPPQNYIQQIFLFIILRAHSQV